MKTLRVNGFYTFALLLFLHSPAFGQLPTLTFQKLSTKDGLLSNFVSAITTDSKGYLWLATRRGLCRYDGYTFQKVPENYTTGAVKSICALADGSLAVYWNATGLFIVNPDNEAITPVDSVDFTDTDPTNDHFENLFSDSRGNLWSSSFGVIRRYEIRSGKRHQYTITGSGQSVDANHFFEDREHRIWILGEQGLYQLDRKHDTLQCATGPEAKSKTLRTALHFSAIAEDNTGNLWLGSPQNQLIRYRPNSGTIQTYPTSGAIRSMAFGVDPAGTNRLWLGCNNGLKLFQPASGLLTDVPSLTKEGIAVRQIQTDRRNGIIWLATNNGLWQYRSGASAIQTVPLPESVVQFPVVINTILPDKDDLFWLGLSHTGVLKWSRKTNDFQLIRYPDKATANNLTWVDGQVWAATNQGIFRLIGSMFQPVHVKTRFSSNAIQKVLADRHNRLWVLHTTEGIQVFDRTTLRPVNLWNEQKARELWTTNRYHDLTESPDGQVWIAAWYPKSFGMVRYNERGKRLQELADVNNHHYFMGDYFNRVSVGQHGRMLFSGAGGVNVTDASGKIDTSQSVYSKRVKGLADDFCLNVAEDTDGIVWIGTGEGLHAFNPANHQVIRFTEVDGLLSDGVTNGFFMAPDDLLLIGQQNGLNLIDIHQLHQPTRLPPLTMSSMQVNGQARQTDTAQPLALKNGENNLRFTFTTLTFRPVSTTHFRYKLTNNPNWVNLNTVNELSLTNLKSGDYELLVQNGDATGRWNPNGIIVRFDIAPAWYESGWFRGLVLLLLLAVLYGFYRLRIGQERRRSELIRQRAEAETRALRAQMNPHFIFNCMNTIDAYILTNRPDAASVFLQKFSRLVRQVLENSRETLIPVSRELETLTLYIELEEERADHRFNHSFLIDPNAQTCLMPPLLLQPFVENAILHGLRHKTGGSGKLIVGIEKQDRYLHCRVEDNGIGRAMAATINRSATSQPFRSLGSTVTTERIESLQTLYGSEATYTITDQNPADGTGTVVDLKLPLLGV